MTVLHYRAFFAHFAPVQRYGALMVGGAAWRSFLGVSLVVVGLLPSRSALAEDAPSGTDVAKDTAAIVAASDNASWTSHLYHALHDRIVSIECDNGSGSGFLFHSRYHIATAFHVVQECEELTVVTEDGAALAAQVVAWDEEHDLAILELVIELGSDPLQLVDGQHGQVGDEVAVMGNPLGAHWRQEDAKRPVWAISRGVISAPPGDLVQTDAAINPGNSGGPLLTSSGLVVGVVSFIATGAQGISFAISARHLDALSKTIGSQGVYSPGRFDLDLGAAWIAAADGSQSGALFLLRGIYAKHYALEFRLGRLGGTAQSRDDVSVTKRERWLGELIASYRLFANPNGALPVGVGLAWMHDDVETSAFVVDVPNPCIGCSILVTQRATKAVVERFRLVTSIAVEVSPLEVGGALYFLGDVDRGGVTGIEDVAGRFNLGLVF